MLLTGVVYFLYIRAKYGLHPFPVFRIIYEVPGIGYVTSYIKFPARYAYGISGFLSNNIYHKWHPVIYGTASVPRKVYHKWHPVIYGTASVPRKVYQTV